MSKGIIRESGSGKSRSGMKTTCGRVVISSRFAGYSRVLWLLVFLGYHLVRNFLEYWMRRWKQIFWSVVIISVWNKDIISDRLVKCWFVLVPTLKVQWVEQRWKDGSLCQLTNFGNTLSFEWSCFSSVYEGAADYMCGLKKSTQAFKDKI